MHKTLNISLIAVILLAIVVCAVLYFNISSLQGPFMFDEAFHAIESLKLARDIQSFDLFALARHASTQIWYPFMHSLISAFFLCIFSETMIVAILPSLVCLFLSAIMVYFLSYEICENKNRATLASIISVVMVLGSPALLFYSTTVVLELMAMALVLINLLVFFKALKKDSFRWYFLSGFLMSLIFFTKYEIGVYFITTIFLVNLSRGKKGLKPLLFILLSSITPILIWLIYPSPVKAKLFINRILHAVSYPQYGASSLIGHIFYYPKIFFNIYSFSYLLSIAMFAGIIYSFRLIRDLKIRTLLVFIVISFMAVTRLQVKQIRYFLVVLPIIFVLSSYMLSKMFFVVKKKKIKSWIKISLVVVFVGIVVVESFRLPKLTRNLRREDFDTSNSITQALNFISSGIDSSRPVAVIGVFNELSIFLIKWHLLTQVPGKQNHFTVTLPDRHPSLRNEFGISSDYYPGYKKEFDWFLKEGGFKYVVIINVRDSSLYYRLNNQDYQRWNRWQLNFIPLIEKHKDYKLKVARDFDNHTLEVRIYEKLEL